MTLQGSDRETTGSPLVSRVVCPHCWERFPPEDSLWIAEHAELIGDAKLGAVRTRFLPSRFTPDGNAMDTRGEACQSLACPRCHLGLARGMLEMEPLFLSILARRERQELLPGLGHLEAATVSAARLRRLLPGCRPLLERDAELLGAEPLPQPRARSPPRPARPDRQDRARGRDLRPSRLWAARGPVLRDPISSASGPRRAISGPRRPTRWRGCSACTTTQVSTSSPAPTLRRTPSRGTWPYRGPCCSSSTRHRTAGSGTPPRGGGYTLPGQDQRLNRQETILNEAAARIRRHAGLPQNARHERPLIVVLSKFDAWGHLLDRDIPEGPWMRAQRAPCAGSTPGASRRSRGS